MFGRDELELTYAEAATLALASHQGCQTELERADIVVAHLSRMEQ